MLLDDGFLDHPKLIRAYRKGGSAAIHLWLGLLSWCRRQLTDGMVPVDVLPEVNGPAPRWRRAALEALLDPEVALLERVSDHELRMHDYLDWNKSREQVELESASRSAAAKARRAKGLTVVRASSERRVSAARASGERRPSVEGASEERLSVSNDNAELDARDPTRHATPRHASPGDVDQIPLIPPNDEPPAASQTASTSEAPRGKPRKPRARTQCPVDLQPDPTTLQTAWELGFTDEQRERVVREFVNYWRGEGALKADWQATLRNRLDNRAEHYQLTPRKPRDKRWLNYQTNLRKGAEVVADPVKPPAEFEHALGSLFGG